MIKALEPCIFEYFVFLVKEQGEYNEESISEITKLWNNIASEFGLSSKTENLLETIQDMSTQIYLDKSVKVLDTIFSDDKKMWLRQDLAHDALIITLLLNSDEGTSTEYPWEIWQKFYNKISIYRNNLNNLFYHGTVLQSILSSPKTSEGKSSGEYIAAKIRSEFPPYRGKKFASVELPSGTLWRFNDNHNFLFTLLKEQEDEASRFLANEFPYLISLLGKIENHYLYAVDLYESLNQMERITKNLELQLPEILSTEETKIIDVKRDEISLMGKQAIENLSSLRICANNIDANLKNLKHTVPESSIGLGNFFTDIFEQYEEYKENIITWSEVGENILMRITKYIDDTKAKMTEYIQQVKMNESLKILPESKKPYTSAEGKTEFEVEDELYKEHEEELLAKPGQEHIEWSSNYLFYEDDALNCFDLFKLFCEENYDALCITRQHPEKVKSKYLLDNRPVKFFWLSTTTCDYCLPPTLTRISHEISKFVKESQNRIIMFDGLEFLINHNDFIQVLKFLDSTKENVILQNSIMIITISPNAFTPKELSLLKKNTEVISRAPEGYDISKLKK